MKRRTYSPETKVQARRMALDGVSTSEIARRLDANEQTVKSWLVGYVDRRWRPLEVGAVHHGLKILEIEGGKHAMQTAYQVECVVCGTRSRIKHASLKLRAVANRGEFCATCGPRHGQARAQGTMRDMRANGIEPRQRARRERTRSVLSAWGMPLNWQEDRA